MDVIMIIHYLLIALSLQEAEIVQVDDVSNWCHPSTAMDSGQRWRSESRKGGVGEHIRQGWQKESSKSLQELVWRQ